MCQVVARLVFVSVCLGMPTDGGACGTGSGLEMGQQRDKSIGIFVFEE